MAKLHTHRYQTKPGQLFREQHPTPAPVTSIHRIIVIHEKPAFFINGHEIARDVWMSTPMPDTSGVPDLD